MHSVRFVPKLELESGRFLSQLIFRDFYMLIVPRLPFVFLFLTEVTMDMKTSFTLINDGTNEDRNAALKYNFIK